MDDADRVNLAIQRTFTALNQRVQRNRYVPMGKDDLDKLREPDGGITIVRIKRKMLIRDRKLRKRQEIEAKLSDLMDQNHDIYAQADVLYTIYSSVEALQSDIYFIKYDMEELQAIYDRMAESDSAITLFLVGLFARIYTTLYPTETN